MIDLLGTKTSVTVFLEGMGMVRGHAIRNLEVHGQIKLVCMMLGIECYRITPSSLHKYAVGRAGSTRGKEKRKIEKWEIIDAANRAVHTRARGHKFRIQDDNEADAFFLSLAGVDILKGGQAPIPYAREA